MKTVDQGLLFHIKPGTYIYIRYLFARSYFRELNLLLVWYVVLLQNSGSELRSFENNSLTDHCVVLTESDDFLVKTCSADPQVPVAMATPPHWEQWPVPVQYMWKETQQSHRAQESRRCAPGCVSVFLLGMWPWLPFTQPSERSHGYTHARPRVPMSALWQRVRVFGGFVEARQLMHS